MLHLQRACRIWADIDLPIELAHTRLLLSRAYSALGNTDEAELEERTAQAAMDRIGAGALRRSSVNLDDLRDRRNSSLIDEEQHVMPRG